MFSNFEEDPIESAGLFEGDIDNVSMDDLQSTDTRVSKEVLIQILEYPFDFFSKPGSST